MSFVTHQNLKNYHHQNKKLSLIQNTITSLPTSFLKPNTIKFQEKKYEKKSVKVGDLVYLCLPHDDTYQEIVTGDNQITQLLQLNKKKIISPQFENNETEFIFQTSEKYISLKKCLFEIRIGQNYYFQNHKQNQDAFADLKINEKLENKEKIFFEKMSLQLNRPSLLDEVQKPFELKIKECEALEINDNERINNSFMGTEIKAGQSIQLFHVFSGKTITIFQNANDFSWKVQKLKIGNWNSNLILNSMSFSQKLEQQVYYGDEIYIQMEQKPNYKFATNRNNPENPFITVSHQPCSFQIQNYCDSLQFQQVKQQKSVENIMENGDLVFLQCNEFKNYVCVSKKTQKNLGGKAAELNFSDFLLEREICYQNNPPLKQKFCYLGDFKISDIYQITVEQYYPENKSFQHCWEIHRVQTEFENLCFTQENYFTLQHVITGLYLCVQETSENDFNLGLTKNPNKLNCYFQVQTSQDNKDFLKFDETFILTTYDQKRTIQITTQLSFVHGKQQQLSKTYFQFEKPQDKYLNFVYQLFQIRVQLLGFLLYLQNFCIVSKENACCYDTGEITNQEERLNDQTRMFHQTINFIQEYLYLDEFKNQKELIQNNQQLAFIESDVITFLLLILNQSQTMVNLNITFEDNFQKQIKSEIIFKIYFILKLIAQNNSQVCKYILNQKILNTNIFLVFLDQLEYQPQIILEFLLELVRMSSTIKQSIVANIFQKLEEITENNIFFQTCYIKILSQTIKNEFGNSRKKCQNVIVKHLFSIQKEFDSKFEKTFFRINFMEEQFFFQFYPKILKKIVQEQNFDVELRAKDLDGFHQLNPKITKLYQNFCNLNKIQFQNFQIISKFFINFDNDKQQIGIFNQYEDYILSVLELYSSLCQDRNVKNRNLIIKNCNLSKTFILKNLIEQNQKTTSIRFTTMLISLFTNFCLDIDPLISFSSLETTPLIIFPENDQRNPGEFKLNNVLSTINVTGKMKKDKTFINASSQYETFCQRQANYTQAVRNEQSSEWECQYQLIFSKFFQIINIQNELIPLDFGQSIRYSQKQLVEYQIDFFSELLRMKRVGINLGFSTYSEDQNIKFVLQSLFFSLFPFAIKNKETSAEFLKEFYTSVKFMEQYKAFCSEDQKKVIMFDYLLWNFQCCKEELYSKTKLLLEALKILAILTILYEKSVLKQNDESLSVDSIEVNILTYLISVQQDSVLKENIKKWWMQDLNASLKAQAFEVDDQLSILTDKNIQKQLAFFNCEDEDQQLGYSLADINQQTYHALKFIKGKQKQQQKYEYEFKLVLMFITKLIKKMKQVDLPQYEEFINYQNAFRVMGGFQIFSKYLHRLKKIQGTQMVLRFYKKLTKLLYLFTKYNIKNQEELFVKKSKQEEILFESNFLDLILINQKFIEIPQIKPIKFRKIFQNCQLSNSIQLKIIVVIFNNTEENTSIFGQLEENENSNGLKQRSSLEEQQQSTIQFIENHLLQINENVKILKKLLESISIKLIEKNEQQKLIASGIITNEFFFQILQPDNFLRHLLIYKAVISSNEKRIHLQYLVAKLHRNLLLLITQCCYKNYELVQQMRTIFNYKQILLALQNENIPYLTKQGYLTLILELFISQQELFHDSIQMWAKTNNLEISTLLNNFISKELKKDNFFLYLDGIIDFGKYMKQENKENLKVYIKKLKADQQGQNFTINGQKQFNNGIIKSHVEFWKFLLNKGLILFLLCLFDELIYNKEILFNQNNKQISLCLDQIKCQLQILTDILLNIQREIGQQIKETQESTENYVSQVILLQKLLPTCNVDVVECSNNLTFHSDQIMLLIHFLRYNAKPKNIQTMYLFYKKTQDQNINLLEYFKITNYFFYLGKVDISKITTLDKELLGNFSNFLHFIEKILEDSMQSFDKGQKMSENIQIQKNEQKRNLENLQEQVKIQFNKVFNYEEIKFRLNKLQYNFTIYQHFYTQFCAITQNNLTNKLGYESNEMRDQLMLDSLNQMPSDVFLYIFEKLQYGKCVLQILTLEDTDQQTQGLIFEFVTKLRDSAQDNMVIAFFELIQQSNKAQRNFTNLVNQYFAQTNLEKEELQNYKQNENFFILFLKFLQIISKSNNFFVFVTQKQNYTYNLIKTLVNFTIVLMNYDHSHGLQKIVFHALKTLTSISSRNQQNSQMIVRNQKLLYILNQQILQSFIEESVIEQSQDNLKMINLILKFLISLANASQNQETIITIINFIDIEFLVQLSEILYQLMMRQSQQKNKTLQKKLKGVGLQIYIFCFLLDDKIPYSLRTEANNLYRITKKDKIAEFCSIISSFFRFFIRNPTKSSKVHAINKATEPQKEFIQKKVDIEKNYLQKMYFCHRALQCIDYISNSNQFYRDNVCKVEVVNERLKLEKVYFKKPDICNYLSSTIKEHIIFETKRDDNSTRLNSFLINSTIYYYQMKYLESISQHTLLKFGLQIYRVQKMLTYLVYVVAVIVIILQNNGVSSESSSVPNETNNYFEQEQYQTLIQILTTLALILNLNIFIFSYIENMEISKKDFDQIFFKKFQFIYQNYAGYQVKFLVGKIIFYLLVIIFSKLKIIVIFFELENFYNLAICILTSYAYVNPFIYTLLLLDIIKKSKSLQNIIRSITLNGFSLLKFTYLGFIFLLIFGFIAFTQFQSMFNSEKGIYGFNLMYIITTTINFGLRNGGGIGDVLDDYPNPENNSKSYWSRYFFDLFFFITFNILFIQIMFGVIIDTFGQLRQKKEELIQEIESKCFICGMNSEEIANTQSDWQVHSGFYHHIYLEHNVYHMLSYIIYLEEKQFSKCNSLQKYIKQCICNKKIDFFPQGTCILLQENDEQIDL